MSFEVIDDDGLPVPQDPAHQSPSRGDARFAHKGRGLGGSQRHLAVAGAIREKEHGAVRVKGRAHQFKEGVVVVVQDRKSVV